MGPVPANHFWRRGRIFAFSMVNFCLRGRIFGAISGEGVRFPARSSEPPTKHRWITIDGGVRSGAALTDQKPSPKMRSKMQPLRQKMQPCNPQTRLGFASRTEANAPLSSEGVAFSTLFSMKGLGFCTFDHEFMLKGSHFWRYFIRRGAIFGTAQYSTHRRIF